MTQTRNATLTEKIRGWVYKYASYPLVVIVSFIIAWVIHKNNLMETIIENASTLAVTGAAIAAFLFTIQSVLISVPKENPFMQRVRRDSRYLVYLHRFCLVAEIAFMGVMLPMLYLNNERTALNIISLTIFIVSMIFTIWSMYIMCRIMIDCERYSME